MPYKHNIQAKLAAGQSELQNKMVELVKRNARIIKRFERGLSLREIAKLEKRHWTTIHGIIQRADGNNSRNEKNLLYNKVYNKRPEVIEKRKRITRNA